MSVEDKTRLRLVVAVAVGVLLFPVLLFSSLGIRQADSASLQTCVPGPHSGVITGTQEWCLGDSPHLLNGDVTVPSGTTLTIEPDVTVMGQDDRSLVVQGHLEAVGTPTQPITFTSVNPGASGWEGLIFDGSQGAGTGNLRYVTVMHGGDPVYPDLPGVENYWGGDIYVRDVLNGEVRLENTRVISATGFGAWGTQSSDYGIYVNNSRVAISGTLFSGIGDGQNSSGGDDDYPLHISGASSVVTMTNNTISGNYHDRVLLMPGAMMGYDTSLPPHNGLDGYVLHSDFTVPPTVTLTIEPGVTVMGLDDRSLVVQGHLEAVGTPTQPITFTSVNPDASGWKGLIFDGSQGAGTGNLRYVTVMRGGDPVHTNLPGLANYWGGDIYVRDVLNGEVHLENTRVISATGFNGWGTSCSDYGVYVNNSRVVISGTLFSAIGDGQNSSGADQDYPLHISGASSMVTMTNNTISGNYHDSVLLMPGAMMGHDTTLIPQFGLDGYVLKDDFTVPATITLTIEPGVTIKAGGVFDELMVEGNLVALGTSTQPITFTSLADSGSGQWAGLVFDGGTGHLRHATVRYAGQRNHVTDEDLGPWARSGIAIRDVIAGEVRLENVTIDGLATTNQDMGIYVDDSNLIVENSLFTGIGNGSVYVFPDTPLYIAGENGDVTLTGNLFRQNSGPLFIAASGTAVLQNNAIIDSQNGGLHLAPGAQVSLLHTTIARNGGNGIYIGNGGAATFTNTIVTDNGVGLRVDAGGAVTMTQTLWHNTTNIIGVVTETGHMDGLALFDVDGYHLTPYSAALERGIDAGMNDDIDGETRPLPAGTAPDLGADEYIHALGEEMLAEMEAYRPQWYAVIDPVSGLPSGRLQQRYMIALYYGSPDADPPDLTVSITDTLPAELDFESQTHGPPMDFAQLGQTLTWQTQQALVVNQTAQVLLSTLVDPPEPGLVITNTAEVKAGSQRFDLQDSLEVPLFPPLIATPEKGEICSSSELSGTQVIGMAMGNAVVKLYENGTEVFTTTAQASGVFSVTYTSARVGVDPLTVLTAVSCKPGESSQCSDPSNPVNLKPVRSFWCPQASSWSIPSGQPYAGQYEFKDPDTGEFSTQDWVIVGPHHFPASTIELRLPDRGGQPPAPYITVDGGDPIDPTNIPALPPWVYNFPVPMRPYDIIFWNNLDPLEESDGGRLIDPDGYIFDVNQGFDPLNPTLNTLEGVTVTCMVSMTEWGGWVHWPAHLYENQVNPQVTGEDGYFAFFTPPGHYYLQVDGINGYQAWRSPVVEVITDIVHVNVPYTPWPLDEVPQAILGAEGPEPAVITVTAGSAVEWAAKLDELLSPQQRMALVDNPALRLLSDLDPISFTDGWDGGVMAPGQVFRRQFATPGVYSYTDGNGHHGEVVVTPYQTYLPLVLKQD